MKLELKSTSQKSSHALAGANIRRELKDKWPDQKFSVRSKSYSGGDSVDVDWNNGPTDKEVHEIINKYQEGSFDGMIDLYTHSHTEFNNLYGGAKYVFGQRNIDESTIRDVWEAIQEACNVVTDKYHETRQALRTVSLYHKTKFVGIDISSGQIVAVFE